MFKKLHFVLIVCLITVSHVASAQLTPDGILFQAVARDANGNGAAGRNIYAKVSLLKGTATGTVAYAESFKVVSTDDGIFTLVIGKGTRTAGATGLSAIDWDADFYFVNIKIAIEPSLPTPGWSPDTEYQDMGTSQLWSVPYALFASRSLVADSAMSISTIVPGSKGGTGVNNDGKTITLAQSLNFKGVGDLTITTTGVSNISLPTTGLLANTKYVSDRIAADTISLSNRIDALGVSSGNSTALKLNIADTAMMLTPYLRKIDTANLSKRINVKLDSAQIPGIIAPYLVAISGVKYTDTASMLSSYYNKTATNARLTLKVNIADTSAMLLSYAIRSNTIESLDAKVNYTDTSAMLLPYAIRSNTIASINTEKNRAIAEENLKVNIADTSAMLLPYAIRSNTIESLDAKVNISDTSAMLLPYAIRSNTIASINAEKNRAITEENLKVNISDTSSMLLPYAIRSNTIESLDTKVNYTDTSAMLSSYYNKTAANAKLNQKVNIADTSAMLLPYAIRSNTIASINAEKTRALAAEALKVNSSDTAAMLLPYALAANVTNNVGQKLNISDTATMLSNYYNKTATDSRLSLKVNNADTANMLFPYAIRSNTEASINTKVNINDTATMLLPYALAANVTNNVGLKLNISDTSSMLLPYAIRSNTEASINAKVNISDTATMLSKYYNKTAADARLGLKVNFSDTANMLLPYAIRSNTIASLDLKAPLASPALTGIPTAPTATTGDISTQLATTAFVAASITNSTTPDATTTTKGKLQLANDLGGTADAPTVEKVGGSSATNINAATMLANAATASNTTNAIVKRDVNGNFTAGTITADLFGTATNVTGIVSAANGGTGVNNTGKTITLGGNINTGGALITTGTTVLNASDITLKTTGTTDLVLPTTGTLTTLTGNEQLTNKTINGLQPTSLATGFSIAGGTISKTLTVNNNATLSGTNTGDQTIILTGDVTGSGTGSFATTLATTGVTAGTYGSATTVPSITVDAKGRVTNVGNTTISGVSPVGSSMSSGKIIVGDVNNVASIVDMSGDVTINNAGVTTIGSDKVTTNKILNSNITYAKIQEVTSGKILGRVSAGNGIVEEVATTGTGDVVRAISPTFTGAPQVPTPIVSSNDGTIANTQFVTRAIGNISASSVTGILPGSNGGTGIDNTGKTITLGGNLVTSGNNSLILTTTGATNVTIPTSGTLATTAQLDAIAGGSFSGGQITGVVAPANGGTGIANSNTITLGGNLLTGAAFTTTGTTGLNASAITLKTTAPSTVILPVTGTLATLDGTETITNKTITAATNTISGLTNSNLSGTAGITDANLATIATAGKVLNTATTATFSNTANAIVSRDASGNFSAGTITASLSGNALTATKLATARTIYGNSFDGTANLSQVIGSSFGGTGNAYTKFAGATSTEKTYTLPDASTTILTTNALVTPSQGGTGVAIAAANTIFAGPVSGIDAAPTFRALTGADLPAGSGLYIANTTTQQANSNFNISNAGVVGGSLTAGSLIKQGGTSSQFLKADGSVDARSFATITGSESLTNKSVNGVTPTAVTTGFTLAGGLTNNKTLTVAADANVSGTNTGDVALSGQDYLSISNQSITVAPVNLSGTNVTGILAAARFPAMTGDITNTSGAVATTISTNAVTNTKIADNAVTTTKIADNAISSAKIATSAVTLDKIASISIQKLLGNKSSTAAGAPGEISIGSGLSLNSTTGELSATGSGGTVTGTGTVGEMPYWSTTAGLSSTPNFTWDNTNKNIKIGEGVNQSGVDSDLPSGLLTPIVGIVGKTNDATEQTMLSFKRPLYYGNSVPGFVDFVTKGGNNSTKFDIRMNSFVGNPTSMVNIMTMLSPGGYVGINNTAPTEKLDVGGNIRFSGALKPNNLAGTAGQFLTSQGSSSAPTWTTISNASTSATGLLTNTDWTTFNNKFSLPALTSGSVLFSNGSTIAQNNSNFFWDNTNSRLGLLTSSPQHTFQIGGETAENLKYGLMDTYYNTLKLGYRQTGWAIRTSNNSGVATDLSFAYDNGTTKTDRMTIGSTGGISIPGSLNVTGAVTGGTGNLTNLDVNSGKIYYNSTNDKIGMFTSAPTSMFQIGGDGGFDNPLKYDYGGEVGTLKFGYRNKEFRIATNTSSGVLIGLVYSYFNGTTNTESMRIANDGLVSIGSLSAGTFKLTGGTPASGKVLTSDATGNASWSTLNAVSSVGAIAGTSNANGATITSGVLNLTPADATNGGIVTNGDQIFSGNKRFLGLVTLNDKIQLNFSGAAGGGVEFTGDGDIVDNNDGYATVRFTNGLKINNAKGSLGTTTKITLGNDGNITSTGTIESVGLKLTGGTPGAGKVLVSDANGVASWASSSPASLSGGVAGAVVYQSGTGTTSFTAAGTTGQILTSSGTNAPTWTSVLSVAQGGTGTSTQNFVDLNTNQTIAGVKTFSKDIVVNGITIGRGVGQSGENVAIGGNALGSGTGARNTAIGSNAMGGFTGTGFNNNTSVGYSNLSGLSTGYGNTSMGAEAMASVAAGGENTAIGNQTLRSATSSYNTVLGASAGNVITTGAGNTIIGRGADVSAGTLNYATAIGYGAVATADNTMQLGNTSLTNVKTSGTITAGAITYPNVAGTNGYVLTTNGTNTATWSAPSWVDLTTAQTIAGVKTFSAASTVVNNNLTANAAGLSGQGLILSDDGDIVDMNDGAATFRFAAGIKINNGNKTAGTTNAITLSNAGNINATGNITAAGNLVAGAITYPNVAGTNGFVLTTNGTNTATWAAPTGAISGGTTNAIPKYTSATALGASSITDDGTNISFSNKTVAGGSAAVNSASIVAATTTYTLQQSDNGKVINCANTGAVTITIPSGLTAGFNCMIVQMAAGTVTISAGTSVTIYNRSNYSKTGGQYAIATIVSPSSNVFITGGDMQ